MPRFEIKVTKRESDWSASQGALQSQKCKSVTDCQPVDTPELARDGVVSVPLSCRAARPSPTERGEKRSS
ncbi:MAG: hypothetical protein ACRDK9_11190 [Solirubrobacterales bacterium]